MGARHADAMAELWPAYGLTVLDGDRTPLDLDELFGRDAPKVLEIGFGMGDTTAAMAGADPGRDYLAAEVHTPGIGNLLALIGEHGLTNVRVAHGDAMELVHRLAPDSLDAVHVFFPDPWPKARHHKRRLIQPGNVRLLRQRLRRGRGAALRDRLAALRGRDGRGPRRRSRSAPHGPPGPGGRRPIREARGTRRAARSPTWCSAGSDAFSGRIRFGGFMSFAPLGWMGRSGHAAN